MRKLNKRKNCQLTPLLESNGEAFKILFIAREFSLSICVIFNRNVTLKLFEAKVFKENETKKSL